MTNRFTIAAVVLLSVTTLSEAGPIRNAISNWRASRGQTCTEATQKVGQTNIVSPAATATPSTPRFTPLSRLDPSRRLIYRAVETCAGPGCK